VPSQSEIVIEHQLPDRTDDNSRDEDRQDEHGPIQRLAARHPAAQQRQQKAEHHLAADRADGKE
jgi:hypothetical protein